MCEGKVLNGYGVSGHPFLAPTRRDEQTFDIRTILFHPIQVLPKGSDGAEQQFISIATNDASGDGTKNSSKRGTPTV